MPWMIRLLLGCLPFYWVYLLLNTQPLLVFDAIGYDGVGRQILDQGLGAYFHQLNREPLFPYMISRAMWLERVFGFQYPYFLKAMLLSFLALTLFGIYRLARLLGAGRVWAGIGVLYAGLSPAILNSTLWLWSEAAALPWAVWGVFFTVKSWRSAVGGKDWRKVAVSALSAAVLFIVLLMVKAAVSVVVMIYGFPFLIAGGVFLARREYGRARLLLMAGVIVLGVFTAAVEGYKTLNFHFNGNYTLTTRFHSALYGNTVRRLEPLTKDRLAQALLSVPRLRLCEKLYAPQACVFWSFQTSDWISAQADEYCSSRKLSAEERRTFLVDSSFMLMLQHPFQQMMMSMVEGAKMLFWENRTFFVRYPAWLTKLYSNDLWLFTLCFGWAFLSFMALLYGLTRRSAGFLLTASFILWFMAAHAIFFIDIRYALPIAPLFIALVIGMLAGVFRGLKSRSSG